MLVSDLGPLLSKLDSTMVDVGAKMADMGATMADVGAKMADMGATMEHINKKIASPSKSISTIGGNDSRHSISTEGSLEFSANTANSTNPNDLAFVEGNTSATTMSSGSVELDA
jgi:hypothetical protein